MPRTTLSLPLNRLVLLGIFMLGSLVSFSQIAAWQFGTPASSGDEVSYAATTLDPNLVTSTELTRGTGIDPTALARGFSANTWDAATQSAAVADEEYYQFELAADAGYQVSLSTLDARIRRTTTAPNAYLWKYSLNGTNFNDIGSPVPFTSNTTSGTNQAQLDLSSIGALQAVPAGTTITFRLYAWGASSTSATFAFGRLGSGNTTNCLAIGGTVAPASTTTNTSVEFVNTSSTVSEAAGTTNLALSITDPDAVNATTVDISASGATGRVTSFSTTVTFPAGSSANENVTVTVDNNAICDGDEDVTFSITGISGGQGTAITGANSSHTLTVLDDDALVTPVATTPSVINTNDFTATWDPSSAATGYRLDVSTNPTFSTTGTVTTTEEFGTAPTAPAGWTFSGVGSYTTAGSSGNAIPSVKFDDSADQVLTPILSAPASDLSFWLKGNSTNAVSALLVEGFDGAVWSTIENINPLPTVGTTMSYPGLIADNFIQFRFTYTKGAGNAAFDDVSYSCECSIAPDFLPGYEDLAVGGTSQMVSGLSPFTTYYFRVRAEGSGCPTTGNSNTVEVTTTAGSSPILSAGSLTDFGAICLNADEGPFSITVEGANLTTDDVTVASLDGLSFSTDELGPFTASLSMGQPGGSFTQEVWVLFTPTAVQSYDGDITIGGGGAADITVAATGSGINTTATLASGSASNIGLDQADVSATVVDQGCSVFTEYGIEYSTTPGLTPGTGTQVPASNLSGGAYSSTLLGLDPCTIYYYLAYGVADAGTSYGGEESFETLPIAAPVATMPGVVNTTDFTATWDAVTGASGYFLDVSTSPTFGTFTPVTVEEGFDGGKGNLPTGWSQTGLGTDYTSAGNYGVALPSLKFDGTNDKLTTAVLDGPATSLSFWYKGQGTASSASQLLIEGFNGASWNTLGILGSIPNDFTDTWSTTLNAWDNYVQFRFTYTKGVGNLAFDDVAIDYTDGVPSYLPGYEALAVAGTSQPVTGLTANTTYYYRLRATGGGCSNTANSNTIEVSTAIGTSPSLSANTLADFGGVCLNADGGPLAFTVEGVNLTSDDVTVAALSGYTFSTDELGTYSASLPIAQSGGAFSQDIWVKFTPTLEQSYAGNITVGGGGAADIAVAATGTGINTVATMATGGTVSVNMDQAEVSGSVTDEGCSSLTGYGIEYSTTQGFSPGSGTAVASTNLSGGSYSSTLVGLTPCTMYYYVAYGTNDGGTSYGSEESFESGPIAAPVATVPGTIGQEDFTATWDAVSGASGYRLDVSTMPGFGTTGSATLEEGFDGGRNGLPAGWSQSSLGTDYASTGNYGASAPSLKFDGSNDQLTTGTLSGPATSLSFWYKGQGTAESASALLIEGYNGSGWSTLGSLTAIPTNFVDTWSTTLNAGDNYVQFRFTYTKATGNLAFDDIAIDYTSIIPSFVSGYNDLAVSGTSHSVTGLDPSTTYYYRVRAEAGSCESGNSNTIPVTTLSCPGNSFIVAINTDGNGDQTSWAVMDENNAYVALGGPYPGQDNTLVTETICIGSAPVSACYQFHLYDSFGDGLSGVGNWQLRSSDGRVLLGDDFANGYESPSSTPLNPNYTQHKFCLPPGPANIAPTECGIFNNLMGNKVYATKVPGAVNYQFEFSDPDAGFIRRIARPYNYVHFWDMVTSPLIPGVKYFARVRTDRDGPMQQAHFGGGCEMGIGLPVVACSELIKAPAYGHSCNELRTFNTNGSFIYAKPVQGATEYQFRIHNSGEGYDQVFTRSTYILQLKWYDAPPLIEGSTYKVEINVKVNGAYSGFCASTCNITIVPSGNRPEASMTQAMGTATMWPNPVRDGQVNLNIDGLVNADQNIFVDIQDMYGKQVFAKEFGNSGERFNTILNLSSDIASGVYLVNITVNGKSIVQRLSIMR